MKIEELSRKTGLSESTIRYYIEHGLMSPEKKNERYVFNNQDYETAKKILYLKSLDLSLEQIAKFLYFDFFFPTLKEVLVTEQREILQNKITKCESEKSNLNERIIKLKEILSKSEKPQDCESYFSFKALDYLECPVCGGKFIFKNAEIKQAGLNKASMICEKCGKSYVIEQGIMFSETHENNINTFTNDQIRLTTKKWGEKNSKAIEKEVLKFGDDQRFSLLFYPISDWKNIGKPCMAESKDLYSLNEPVIKNHLKSALLTMLNTSGIYCSFGHPGKIVVYPDGKVGNCTIVTKGGAHIRDYFKKLPCVKAACENKGCPIYAKCFGFMCPFIQKNKTYCQQQINKIKQFYKCYAEAYSNEKVYLLV